MLNRYIIKFTATALEDLDLIYKYISEELLSPRTAVLLDKEIMSQISKLALFPKRCSYVEEPCLRKKSLRKLIFKNFIILYKVDNNNKLVIIYTIKSCRENYIDLIGYMYL